jgi:hypothetical protein
MRGKVILQTYSSGEDGWVKCMADKFSINLEEIEEE